MSGPSHLWRVYVLPAAVFQSVMIGGGYGTGREIVEFFTRFGVFGGLCGLMLVTGCFAALLAVSYEFARRFQAYDYRRFFRELLGRGWIAFEILYLAMFSLVLAVIAAAAGELFKEHLHVPPLVGIGALLLVISILTFYGREWVTRILAFKAAVLSVIFVIYFLAVVGVSGPRIAAEVGRSEIHSGWVSGALHYVLYSSVIVPAMLFSTSAIRTRREAVLSGAFSSVAGLIPGILLHLSFAAGYPDILAQTIPIYWMIQGLAVPALTIAYLIVLFGCLLDTGLCFIQSVNERLDGWQTENHRAPISPLAHAGIAALCIAISGGLAMFGVVNLIAKGYATMGWGFLALYVGPIFVRSLFDLTRRHQEGVSL